LSKRSIEELIESVAGQREISPELIRSNSRQRKVTEARAIVAYSAVEEAGHSMADVARYLGMKHPSVSYAVRKGEGLLGQKRLMP
jgi:chromosomal replication initiation ATPase DnaA